MYRTILLTVACCFLFSTCEVVYKGINECGMEFGNMGDVYGQGYIMPTTASVDYFIGKGMNTIRFPFRWERIQPTLNGAFNSQDLSRMQTFINYITGSGRYVVLDVHNYARYNDQIIGTGGVTKEHFADLWKRLAEYFGTNNKVIFGIMNEPFGLDSLVWLEIANTAIAAIRSTGSNNLVLVPGVSWTGAQSWEATWYGTPNAVAMSGVVDSANNYAYELHQYFDEDYSGKAAECFSTSIGVEGLTNVTKWLRNLNKKGFLAEFSAPSTPTCHTCLNNTLKFVHDNSDVWMGWTAWAAGPYWGTDPFSLEPTTPERPQMAIYSLYLQEPSASTTGSATGSITGTTTGSVGSTAGPTSGSSATSSAPATSAGSTASQPSSTSSSQQTGTSGSASSTGTNNSSTGSNESPTGSQQGATGTSQSGAPGSTSSAARPEIEENSAGHMYCFFVIAFLQFIGFLLNL